MSTGTVSHAYLICGLPQTGKMTLAKDLAMALNCSAAQDQRPCGNCSSCRKIAEGKHADVQVINLDIGENGDGKERKLIGIGQINDVLHSANLPPFEGRQRVYIIEEAGDLSLDAANRLLKTLEEPPAGVTFILLTANLKLIPATVISRCQKLSLSRMKTSEIESLLVNDYKLDTEKAALLARLSRGCPGKAVELVQNSKSLEERREAFEKMLEVAAGGYSERFASAAQMAQQYSKKRETVYGTLEAWTDWWRDILLAKTGCDSDIINIDYRSNLSEMAGNLGLADIKETLQSFGDAMKQLKMNVNPRLVLESLMLNMARPGREKAGTLRAGVRNA